MGRHSRKGPAPQQDSASAADTGSGAPDAAEEADTGSGRRRRGGAAPAGEGPVPPAYAATPAHGVPQVRGGHPEQREPGGGWGAAPHYGDWHGGPARSPLQGAAPGAATAPGRSPRSPDRERDSRPETRPEAREPGEDGPAVPGPRREFIDAFDAAGAFDAPVARTIARQGTAGRRSPAPGPTTDERTTHQRPEDERATDDERVPGRRTGAEPDTGERKDTGERNGAGAGGGPGGGAASDGSEARDPDARDDARDTDPRDPDAQDPAKGGKGRALTGIAAAAVTTVLAVVVAGQVADGGSEPAGAAAAGGLDRADRGADASRSDGRTTPTPSGAGAPAVAPTYAQLMSRQFPLAADLTASGEFSAVPGLDKAPGKGQKFRYRVDIENGLGLDGKLFADAVQKTLNDKRSWAHDGAMTFERVSSGRPDFVITLASPGTTGFWCEKSGLDTTVDNVSCDSAATDRVMINAFRWARGAKTFGAKSMHSYRQMLINHEVGHRLGHNHESCRTPGALAPVMQQQTKTLDIDGIKCRPNPWVFPTA
ncbi:DUF3152 domain-containing protein [Streptomyces sp. NPDC012623]|uniref:DUF3152 domain-containing protein n=1 Tax=unclassified Streptomyces TaxID=2593676 RepID=UPI0036A96832